MKKIEYKYIGFSLMALLLMSGCASKSSVPASNVATNLSFSERIESSSTEEIPKLEEISHQLIRSTSFGQASWYGDEFEGKKTASGEIYDRHELTAAHRTLPFDTMVRVTDMVTNKSTVVRINDRGPLIKDRIIDLSYEAAKRLGLLHRGKTDVRLDVLGSKMEEADTTFTKLSKGEGCSGGKCMATIAVPSSKVQTIEPKEEEILSVDEPQSEMAWNQNTYDYLPAREDLLGISSKISVQVGAFRKHAGAKVYAKRYSLLTDQYHVKIKKGFKDSAPIYRVQLQGFNSEVEARAFIREYGIDGAFLVRR